MKQLKILSISNSFGVNLQTYAHQIAKANDLDLDFFVLYIGGCSLQKHVENIHSNEPIYELYHNGKSTSKYVSILDGLKIENWDYVLTQQVSSLSGFIESFYPFLNELVDFVKRNAKFKKLGFQETWEYGKNTSEKDAFKLYNFDSNLMHEKIRLTYEKLMEDFPKALLINSGDVIHEAIKQGFDVYDGAEFHLNSLGCYLIGANLVRLLTRKKLRKDEIFTTDGLDELYCSKIIDFINNL